MPMTLRSRFCPSCNQDRARILYRPKHSPGPVVRCYNCGMVYVSPIEDDHALIFDGPENHDPDRKLLNSNNLEDIAGCWELSFLPPKTEERVLKNSNAQLLDIIAQFRSPPGRLLDFGCGFGFFLGAAKNRGWEHYGLEPLPGAAVYARAKFGAHIVTDTLRDHTFPSNFFDVITAFQVFEHLPNPARDLSCLWRMIKPGGIILIEVPNIENWSVKLFGKRHRHFVQDHINFFSVRSLTRVLKNKGFQVRKTYFPFREMTIRYLIEVWAVRYLPKCIVGFIAAITETMSLSERTVKVNLGDIVAVIASKDRFM